MRRVLIAVCLVFPATAHAQGLEDAFTQGRTFGQGANARAHGSVDSTHTTKVPNFDAAAIPTDRPSAESLGANARARLGQCASAQDATCAATQFTQTNPTQHQSVTIDTQSPPITRGRQIGREPNSVLGTLAGTYSDCTLTTQTDPPASETELCHRTRMVETLTCDRVLTVVPAPGAGCTPGQFLTRIVGDLCPWCPDVLAMDFSCGVTDYTMHVRMLWKGDLEPRYSIAQGPVPGRPGVEIPVTPGLSRFDAFVCFDTSYEQHCNGSACTLTATFRNPCQALAMQGSGTFTALGATTFTDQWDDQCQSLEARTR